MKRGKKFCGEPSGNVLVNSIFENMLVSLLFFGLQLSAQVRVDEGTY